MSGFTPIDFSKLPAPEVIAAISYDDILQQMKAEMISRLPDIEPYIDLESEPVAQLLRVFAYYRMVDRAAFNDGVKANMLALATGTNLDNLAALWGVERLVIQSANARVSPPIEEITERDEDFRARIHLSIEAATTAGPKGSYAYLALSAHGDVKGAAVTSPAPGEVAVTILSHSGDGTPSDEVLSAVEAALNAEDARPLCDQVTVRAAAPVPYNLTAVVILAPGPDAAIAEAALLERLDAYLEAQGALGQDITRSGLFSALHQQGVVQNVQISAPAADISIAENEIAYCVNKQVAFELIGGTND